MSADSEESFDDGTDMRLRSVTSIDSKSSKRRERARQIRKRPEETHF
jgi:hypothetical protein